MQSFRDVVFRWVGCWIILSIGSTGYSFAQSNGSQNIDSVLQAFDRYEGAERAMLIANHIRNVNLYEFSYEPLKPYLEEAYEWEAQNPDPVLLNMLRLGSVNVSIAEGEKLEAVRYLTEILDSGVELTPEDSVSTYDFLQEMYLEANAHSEAWAALHILDRVITNHSESSPFMQGFQFLKPGIFAAAYFELGEMSRAIEQFKMQIEIAHEEGNLHREAGTYNNIGLAWLGVNEPDSALKAFNESKSVWNRFLESRESVIPNDRFFLEVINGNIGYAYNQKGLYAQAIPLLEREIQVHGINQNYNSAINGLNELSRSYFGLKDFDRSLSLLDSAAILLEEFPHRTSGAINNMEYRINVLQELDQYEEAYYIYKDLVAYQDSIAAIQDKERLDVLQVVYEVEQKNREIQEQELRVLTVEATAGRNRIQIQLLGAGVVLLLLATGFVTVLSNQRRKKNEILAEKNDQIAHQNEVIEQSLIEKETLLKEIHHRVKNNLQIISSLLNLQSEFIEDDVAMEAVSTSKQRVMSMSMVHEVLYSTEDLKEVNVTEYIPKLVEYISHVFSHEKARVDIQYKLDPVTLDIKKAVPLGLILNELITNAFKYAFGNGKEGVLSISAKDKGETLLLVISDNGPGFEQGAIDHDKPQSLGLQLVDDMVRQLKASKKVITKEGTTYELAIPISYE